MNSITVDQDTLILGGVAFMFGIAAGWLCAWLWRKLQ